MSDSNLRENRSLTRRRVLQSTGTVGLLGLGSVGAGADDADGSLDEADCSETTLRPGVIHYDDSIHEVCTDEHPESEAIQEDVRVSLEENYPTVGALIDEGFIPYFDFLVEGSWSHWINPEYIGDEWMLDPARPESILVDHTYWRPFGVMFIATEEGEAVDPPPTVYDDETEDGGNCTPWHAHVGLPGRYAWWKYQNAFQGPAPFPCRTPWMLHVWVHSHLESIYAHSAPRERGGPPAEPPGFETDADPDEEELGLEHLPDALRYRVKKLW